jgi:hypothetical protein
LAVRTTEGAIKAKEGPEQFRGRGHSGISAKTPESLNPSLQPRQNKNNDLTMTLLHYENQKSEKVHLPFPRHPRPKDSIPLQPSSLVKSLRVHTESQAAGLPQEKLHYHESNSTVHATIGRNSQYQKEDGLGGVSLGNRKCH